MFFFEKKNQKTFASLEPGVCNTYGPKKIKVFFASFSRPDQAPFGARPESGR